MDSPYKVEFLSTVAGGKFTPNKPVDQLDLCYQLEALLVERSQQGYKMVKIIDHRKMNVSTGKDLSGLIVVFEKVGD